MEAIRLDEDAALKAAGALQGACEFESHRFRLDGPVAQRQGQLPYKETISGSSPLGTTEGSVVRVQGSGLRFPLLNPDPRTLNPSRPA